VTWGCGPGGVGSPVVIGHRRVPSATLARPRDGPELIKPTVSRPPAAPFDAPRSNLSRRQPATTAGPPTDGARVCSLHPHRHQPRCHAVDQGKPWRAGPYRHRVRVRTVSDLENRRGGDVTVGSNPTPTAGERPLTRQNGRGPSRCPVPVRRRGSPWFPARSGTDGARTSRRSARSAELVSQSLKSQSIHGR
jgi:hypothetical protein